ncbi:hypothetical protein NECID01_0638 [Nematocida sp. AWRm77]|nr:hypothetical protein NECID01_0638 [Nematocida sp. AWRm77]
MKKLIGFSLIILRATAIFHSTQTSVSFQIENETTQPVIIPKGMFKTVDTEADQIMESDKETHNAEHPVKIEVKEEEEEEEDYAPDVKRFRIETPKRVPSITLALATFRKSSDINHFRSLCCASNAYMQSLAAEQLQDFLIAADFLGIQGGATKYFVKNMVRYGLLGEYSEDITETNVHKKYSISRRLFVYMLLEFLGQMGLPHKIECNNTEQAVLVIGTPFAPPTKLSKPCAEEKPYRDLKVELHSRVPARTNSELLRNKKVLRWLLHCIRSPSIDICYSRALYLEPFSVFKETIAMIYKEYSPIPVVGITLILNTTDVLNALSIILQSCPGLSRLCLSINGASPKDSKSIDFSKWESLKDLKIVGFDADTQFITKILPAFLNIETLAISCTELDFATGSTFANCPKLSMLTIDGKAQTSLFVQKLTENLPSIRILNIPCKSLSQRAISRFARLSQLESLDISGAFQSSNTLQSLLASLSPLRKLALKCIVLEENVTDAFKKHPTLEILNLSGAKQTCSFVQALLERIPGIKELEIVCKVLEEATADIFAKCLHLEKLVIWRDPQTAVFLKRLLKHLPLLRELIIQCSSNFLKEDIAENFIVCPRLTSLSLLNTELSIPFIVKLLQYVPHIQNLRICTQALNQKLANALQEHKNLQNLTLIGKYVAGFANSLLQSQSSEASPTLQSLHLKTLNIVKGQESEELNEADKTAMQAAKCKGISILC